MKRVEKEKDWVMKRLEVRELRCPRDEELPSITLSVERQQTVQSEDSPSCNDEYV